MKKTVWLCEECRKVLERVGYATTVQVATHAVDTCEQCKRRTVVLYMEIRKGKEA